MMLSSPTRRRTILAALAAAPFTALAGRQSPVSPAAAVVARFRRAYEALDDIALEDLLAPNVRFEDPTFHLKFDSFDAMRPMIADVKRSTRAITVTVEHEFVCGEWVVARQTQTVTRTANPTRPVVVRGVSLFRVEGDRIVEWFDYYDAVGYQRQIGGQS